MIVVSIEFMCAVTKDAVMAAALTMNATTDMDLGFDAVYVSALPEAIERGLVHESTITSAVERLMQVRIRLGDFDPPSYAAVLMSILYFIKLPVSLIIFVFFDNLWKIINKLYYYSFQLLYMLF